MPTVARYGARKVETAALPAARRTAAETPESEGLAVAQAEEQRGQVLGQLGNQGFRIAGSEVGRMVQEEKDRADDVALLNAQNQLGHWENQRIYDPTDGALTVKGKDAFGLPEQVAGEYEKVTGEIAGGLTTDKQRFAFQKLALERGLSVDLTLRRHVYGEMQHYEAQELTAYLANSQSRAIAQATDARAVGVELQSQVDAIRTHAPRLGLGPEEVEQQVENTRSATHIGVIQNLLAQDQTKSAQVYFDETKSQIKGDQIARIEASLKEGHVRKDAQQQADTILAAGGTLTEQRNKAKAITDPDVRDATLQYLEHENALQEHATLESERAASKGAYDILDATRGNLHQIPPSTWASFDGGLRSALRGYAEHVARGVPVETDFATYYKLLNQAGDDPGGFVSENLLRYKATVGETELKQLAGLQLSIKNGNREAALKELGPARLQEAVIDDSLTLYGIDPKTKDTTQLKAIAQLRTMLRNRVETQQALTNKPVTDAELRQMTDQILATPVAVPGSWWGLWPWSSSHVGETTGKIFDVTIDQIPAGMRTRMEQSLRSHGEPVSDARILSLYQDYLATQNAQSVQSRTGAGPRVSPAKPGTAQPAP